jgi:periplasmic copper chaperone A
MRLLIFFLTLFNFADTLAEELKPSSVLQINNAWVKLAPPSASVNAAYLELRNTTDSSVVITEITADCCGHVMLHETKIDGDKASMHHLDELNVQAKSNLVMRPGGLHIMLMQIKTPLVVDAKVQFILTFADGRQQQFGAMVKRDE